MHSAGQHGKRCGRTRHRFYWLQLMALALPLGAGLLVLTQPSPARWPDALFLIVTVVATLVAMRTDLPLQNVFLASAVVVMLATGVEVLGIVTPFPFGPRVYLEAMGDPIVGPLPWAAPLFWLALLPNARGVSRLILQDHRKEANYGLWVIGLATLLASGFALGMEIMARDRGYWRRGMARPGFDWYGAPWAAFFGYAITAVFLLVLTMPALIRKQPGHRRTHYRHLYLWLVLNSLPAVSAYKTQSWAALVIIGLWTLVPSVFAWRRLHLAMMDRQRNL